jgi:signal transduction histidine kinase
MVWPGGHGKQFDVSVTTSPLMDQHNVPVGTVYVAHDITERKQAEELLKESLSLKRATLDSTADGILVVNSQAKVVDYNSKFTELWNIPPELMEQKDDGRLLQHVLGQLKYPEAFANKVRELYNNPDADDFDEIPFTDGRIFERYSTPHRLEGKSVGRVWSFRDVTERKQAEARLKCYSEELVEINEELKSFAYIVSHDLRAPLVNIKGFSQELDRSLREIELCVEKHLPMLEEAEKERITPILKKDIPEALKFIGSSVNRMDNLINAILKLSRAGRRKLVPEPVSVYDLVQNILRSFAHQIGTRHICVAVNELPDIVADRTALEQIFGNLIDNAVKYLEPGRNGELELSAEKNDGEVIFHVRDNGRGMEKEDIPKAFEIFRRVGRQDVPGEGMGLSYVKTLVRLLGGRIWCESEIDNGTTFSFALPQR